MSLFQKIILDLLVIYRISNDEWTSQTIRTIRTNVRVPEVCSSIICSELVSKCRGERYWAVRNHGWTIHGRCEVLIHSMPMERDAIHIIQHVGYVHYNCIASAYLYEIKIEKWSS